jgi:hypothetical protein
MNQHQQVTIIDSVDKSAGFNIENNSTGLDMVTEHNYFIEGQGKCIFAVKL